MGITVRTSVLATKTIAEPAAVTPHVKRVPRAACVRGVASSIMVAVIVKFATAYMHMKIKENYKILIRIQG